MIIGRRPTKSDRWPPRYPEKMLTTAAARKATPTSRDVASSSSTAQMPTKTQPAENAAEPTSVTASTGRRDRSTSVPQIRRKTQANRRTPWRLSTGRPGPGSLLVEGVLQLAEHLLHLGRRA